MRKILTAIVIIFLTTTLLSGCTTKNQNQKHKSPFLGTWSQEGEGQSLTYKFYQNGTYERYIGETKSHGSWQVSDDKLILSITGQESEPWNYNFSNDQTTLTITSTSTGFSFTLQKQE